VRQAPAGPKVTTQADRHRDDKPGIANPGCWAGFGGAVEDGETVEEALRREVAEETGLVITDPVFLTDAVDYEGDGRLVSLFYVVGDFQPDAVAGEAEPDRDRTRRGVLADIGQCLLAGAQQHDFGGGGQPATGSVSREAGLQAEFRARPLGDPSQRVLEGAGLELG